MFKGFREFIARGNAVDLAVGVVIGAAFTTVINSIVNNVFNPLIGAVGGKSLNAYRICISEPCGFDEATQSVTGVAIGWGAVLAALINFLLVAAAVYFFAVVPMNALAARRAASGADVDEEVQEEIALLREIRDSLAAGRSGDSPPD